MARRREECPACEEAPIWLTTYSDMVTLLLTFFVMLFSLGKEIPKEIFIILSAFSNTLGFFEGGQTLQRARLEDMGLNVESLPSETRGRALSKAKTEAISIFKPEIQAKKVRVEENERGLVISLIGADYFEPGSAKLTPAIEEVLKKVSYLLKDLKRYTRIEGHAGAKEVELQSPYAGERKYKNSWDLASARAVEVATYLQSLNVNPSLLQALSYGSYRPLVYEGELGTPEADAHNRRIDIVILPYREPLKNRFDQNNLNPPSLESMIPD
ncbi:MAG: flagellar motor protein MotB [Leptospiraceae bacterium]|nr:flagellar motor protein MotB [Leptospiraceae bacterium]MDW7975429.1 OmpA family protein [Leptospiraceae bacterium]